MNETEPGIEPEPLMTAEQVAKWLNVDPTTLRNWRAAGTGPTFLRFSTGSRGKVRYPPAAVRAWLADRVR